MAAAAATKQHVTDVGTFDIAFLAESHVIITGKLKKRPDDGRVSYTAAAPAEIHMSISGSGLPYANREQAFHATPSTGSAPVNRHGRFEIKVKLPGSYYVGLGTILVQPTLFLTYLHQGSLLATHVPIRPPLAYRFGTYPMQFVKPRDGPMFYSPNKATLPRTQEQILRDSAYPVDAVMAPDFWGSRPPR